MSDLISREKLLNEINLLKKSPWYNKDFAAAKIVRKDAVAAVEMCIKEAPGVAEWISVKDKMPDDGMGCYLVLADLPCLVGKYIDIAWYNAYNMYGRNDFNPWYHREDGINYEGITHWMPLPQKPESIEVQHE